MSELFQSVQQGLSNDTRDAYESPRITIINLNSREATMQTVSNGENLNKREIDDDDFWA